VAADNHTLVAAAVAPAEWLKPQHIQLLPVAQFQLQLALVVLEEADLGPLDQEMTLKELMVEIQYLE
jgi:hypothetical protein